MSQNYVFTIFLQNFSHGYQITLLKIAAKIIFISRKINLNIQNLKISVIFAVQYIIIAFFTIQIRLKSNFISLVW